MRASPIARSASTRALALLRSAIAKTRLDALAPAARSPAFAPGLARFVAELEARRIEPPRFTAAMRAWAGGGPRRRYAQELAALYSAYRSHLDRLGRPDRELHDRQALDAITLAPERWRATPVFCYGFDDLDALQLDAIETLARRVGAPVTVSLPGERGRVALSGRAATLETLRPFAAETIELPPTAAYYEDPALHHLERTLFEDGPRSSPGGAVHLLEGGDERAEAELVAHEVADLIAGGFDPAEVAIVTRTPARDLLADALAAAGIPHTLERRDRLDSSVTGRALLALLRVAAGEADAGDLVAWLAVHAGAGPKRALESFEARLRREGISDLPTARAIWERDHGKLRLPGTIDHVEAQLHVLLVAGHEHDAALLDPREAAAAAAARRALGELRELGRSDPRAVGGLSGIAHALSAVTSEQPGDGEGVTICDALSLRARRVRALFLYGTQEGIFPAPQREEGLLGSAERAELAAASGLWLSPPIDHFAAERYLFYALCSRPTARLYVSWHEASDAGEATPASLFVDELRDCFDVSLYENRRTRPVGALGWPGDELQALLAAPRRRAVPIAPLGHPERLAALKARNSHSASGLESWARCPVGWLVEHALDAEDLAPRSIWMRRGSAAHDALEAVVKALGRVDRDNLPMARELLEAELALPSHRISDNDAVDRAERRRLRAELWRYLDYAASLRGEHVPAATELAFGVPQAELDAVELDPALALCGRIDRIDVDASRQTAIVYDYKTGRDTPGAARWVADQKFQPALYMLAAERLLGVEAVGGLYQPLRADLRARGAIRSDLAEAEQLVGNDLLDAGALRALLDERLAAAIAVAGEIERGELEPRPLTCSSDGCRYKAICRIEAT